MFIYVRGEYRPIEQATFIKPVMAGTRCNVIVYYPDMKEPVVVADQQAPSILEYVLRRRIGITHEEALDSVFKAVEEHKERKRKKRTLKDPEASKRRMSEAALKRWARQRELSPA